jgi:hypothetical protein
MKAIIKQSSMDLRSAALHEDYKHLRSQMRSYALRFRIAIHPDHELSLGKRISEGAHFLRLAITYRNLSAMNTQFLRIFPK